MHRSKKFVDNGELIQPAEKRDSTCTPASTESLLIQLWAKLFDSSNLSPDSDFMECGGHSLLAVKLITQIQETFGVPLNITQIFENPTVRGQCQLIETARLQGASPSAFSIERTDRNQALTLSSIQELILLDSLKNPNSPIYNEVTTIHLGNSVECDALEQAFSSLIQRHEIFRTTYEWETGELTQTVQEPVLFKLPQKDFRDIEPDKRLIAVEDYANENARIPFDLKNPPLIRAFVGILEDNDYRLYITTHHIAGDAFSNFDIVHIPSGPGIGTDFPQIKTDPD